MNNSWRWFACNLLLVAFGGVLGIVILEASLRIFAPINYHEWMEWRPDGHIKGRGLPNQDFKNATGEKIYINDLGFRGPTPSFKPEPGTFRILTLGGSSTFGYHAKGEDKTWPQQLAQRLRSRFGRQVEVINLALPGFDSQTSSVNFQVT